MCISKQLYLMSYIIWCINCFPDLNHFDWPASMSLDAQIGVYICVFLCVDKYNAVGSGMLILNTSMQAFLKENDKEPWFSWKRYLLSYAPHVIHRFWEGVDHAFLMNIHKSWNELRGTISGVMNINEAKWILVIYVIKQNHTHTK